MAGRLNGSGPSHSGGGRDRTVRLLRLLYPGIRIKRWALLGALGVAICSIGVAYLLRKFLDLTFPDFLPWYSEGFLLLAAGGAAVILAIYGFYRSLGTLALRPQSLDLLADSVYNRWLRSRGPRVVAIGGGMGLSVLLRGLTARTDNLTAIITVADDGGSSGRLSRELGVLPPGDFRNCLVAMSDDESLLADLFQYRFDSGNGLKGHSFGNLFIVAMTSVTNSFDQALVESSRMLSVRGSVIPATPVNIQLSARFLDGQLVRGESSISAHGGQIDRLMIEPDSASAHPLAVQAIEQADLIVIGPGSLYTSILPNLLVPGIADALMRSNTAVVYVCNVATQSGETEGYTVALHVAALQSHTFDDIADFVLCNSESQEFDIASRVSAVVHDGRPIDHTTVVLSDLVDPTHPVRHDSEKLADAVMDIYRSRNHERVISQVAS